MHTRRNMSYIAEAGQLRASPSRYEFLSGSYQFVQLWVIRVADVP